MNSFLNLRLCVYSIPVIFSLLFSWINCEDVPFLDDGWDEWFHRTRFQWVKITVSTISPRNDYKYDKDSATDLKNLRQAILFIIGVGILLMFIFVISLIIRQLPFTTGSRNGLLRSSRKNGLSGRNGGGNNYASRPNSVADRPQDYSVVVISELIKKEKFPEVKTAQSQESPPPMYGEMNMPKF